MTFAFVFIYTLFYCKGLCTLSQKCSYMYAFILIIHPKNVTHKTCKLSHMHTNNLL